VSAFRDLLKAAHAKGVKTVSFEVDLVDFFADEQHLSWVCMREDADADGEPVIALGRTGEEALRFMVEKIP